VSKYKTYAAAFVTAALLIIGLASWNVSKGSEKSSDLSERINLKFYPVSERVCAYPGQRKFCDSPIKTILECSLDIPEVCDLVMRVGKTDPRLSIQNSHDRNNAEIILTIVYEFPNDRRDPGLLVAEGTELSDVKVDIHDRLQTLNENISLEISSVMKSIIYTRKNDKPN